MPPRNFALVDQQIYRGGEPSLQDIKLLKDVYRIARIISLDLLASKRIDNWLKYYKIEHLTIPINSNLNRFDDNLTYLIRNIAQLLAQKQPVYIHCLHGRDRTGLIIAAYRIKKQRWSFDQAMNEARKFGFGNGLNKTVRDFYIKILQTLAAPGGDVASADDSIVSLVRDDMNRPYPPIYLPQLSFAPYQPYYLGNNPIGRENLLQVLLDRLDDQTGFYQPGVRTESVPLRGAGPVENSAALSEFNSI